MAMKKTEVSFQIPKPAITTIAVKIEGTSPIIFHRWDEKAIKMILDKQMKKATKGREIRDPEKEYRNSFYTDADGYIYIPSRNIKQAIVGSARFLEGIPMTILRGAVFIWGETQKQVVPVLHKGKKIKLSQTTTMFEEGQSPIENVIGIDSENPDIHIRQDMVTVGMGSADIRFRGEIDNWEAKFLIEFDSHLLSAEQILNLIQRAGFSQGLMEWRAEKNGDNGSFKVSMTSESALE